MKKTLKILYLIILLALLFPITQYTFSIIKMRGLDGSYVKKELQFPKLESNSFLSGTYQKQATEYWQEEMGLRKWFIRLNNQINYSLFDVVNSQGGILGKDNVLLFEGDIKSYFGVDYVGNDRIVSFIEKTKFVQDSFARRNVFFFLFIAPSKASVYSENIPNKYFELYKSETTNYNKITRLAKESSINLFDAKQIILNDKRYKKHPAFPKMGIHWSGNTTALIADSLVNYINFYSNHKVRDIKLSDGEITVKNYRYTDYDMGEAMNLLWHVSEDYLHYPSVKYGPVKNTKPTFLGVGDSFIQSFKGFYPILDSVFSKQSNMWYYNKVLGWPENYNENYIPVMNLDLEKEINKRDIIILEMTEENLKSTGYKFVDDLYQLFKGEFIITKEKRNLYNKLITEKELIEQAKYFAPLVGYSLEEMKTALVKNKLKNEFLINFDYEKEIEMAIRGIEGNEEWFNAVKAKAIEKNVPLEEAIRADAKWIVDQKLGY